MVQFSEWMSSKRLCSFSSGDQAVQLDLIGVVHGVDAAERYFNNLTDQEKNEKVYGALLNCYVREGLVDKSLSHVEKMKENGYISSPLAYNNLMCLYSHTGELEKIPEVLFQMKNNGIFPNSFSYKMCICSYGEKSDFENVEKLLKEMEGRPHKTMDWATYSTAANVYIKAGLKEKALIILKKLEEKLDKDALGYNHLITLYTHLGNKDEVMRLWRLQKVICKKQINRDYITMMGMLVKLGELEEAEALLEEWESSYQVYDFRVPNTLLIGYCQKGRIDKAEARLRKIIEKGKTPVPNCWAILAIWCLDGEKMKKAYEYMKEALAVREQNRGWRPKPKLISSLLDWIGENGEAEEVEGLVDSLKKVVGVNREMYHALIKASIRGGREVEGILDRMKSDQIDEDEETEKILSSRH